MLTIRRCPTVVSNYQETLDQTTGCGHNCLGACCIHGAKLPVYSFVKFPSAKGLGLDFYGESDSSQVQEFDAQHDPVQGPALPFLNTLILAQWEDRLSRGLFRYDVTACETKVLPGEFGFIAQLNEGRHLKKRPTEFRVDKVLQPFDLKKFNFTKVGQEELLFCFEESEDKGSNYNEMVFMKDSPNVVIINVSPIEYGHVLLVPRVLDCIPQQLETETFLLALHFALEANDPYFRLGYNSLGAFATINHLHFQAYYLATPFPVERAPVRRLNDYEEQDNDVKIFELTNYPVRGVVYELGKSLEELVHVVSRACSLLQNCNIPFNVLIADRGTRVFLFPQCYAERQARGEVEPDILETQVNPAVWEISGHIVLKRKENYEMASEDYAWKLLTQVSFSEEAFSEIKHLIFSSDEGMEQTSMAGNLEKLNLSQLGKDSAKAVHQGLNNGNTKLRKNLSASEQVCI